MPGKNLETKNTLERDETKEGLINLENEVKINKEIDETFDKFRLQLMTNTAPDYELRAERDLKIEKMKNGKVKLKSYGETCELDLRTGKISYLKGNKPIVLDKISLDRPVLDKSSKINKSYLRNAFGEMNVINRAISMSKKTEKKDFYFEDGGFLQRVKKDVNPLDYYGRRGRILKVDGKPVISSGGLRLWFGDANIRANHVVMTVDMKEREKFEAAILDTLNGIVL